MIETQSISVKKKYECCGCTACINICPKDAIHMERDEQGFNYPIVDDSRCVECGLCLKTCTTSLHYKYKVISCYAAKNNEEDVVLLSSSGGIVDAFCKEIISRKGIVYASCYNNSFELVYKRATSYEECKAFRRSKYVQSSLKGIFQQIYEDVKQKKTVLFVGSSCYVSGLRAYLTSKKIDCSSLYLIDFICHGVPSPGVFEKYVRFINDNNNLADIVFRNKRKKTGEKLDIPWQYGRYSCSLEYKDGHREVDSLKSRIYLNLFTSNICLRPQCYKCNYIGIEKPGDITVADFWGIENEHPDFADQQGVSAIMIHTKQGQELFKSINNIYKETSSIDKISRKQGMLRSASKKNEQYEEFWEDYKKYNFRFIAKKYGEYNLIGKIRQSRLYSVWVKLKYSV